MHSTLKALTALAVAAAATLAGATTGSAAADGSAGAAGESRWAPAATATIHPGVEMYTAGAQCTANFVYTDAASRVYVGYAAHCAGKGAATDTDGCRAGTRPLGTRVRFAEGGSLADGGTTLGHGRLVYSSWSTMHRLGTTAENPCAYNDLAMVRVGPELARKVNPSIPFFGGPTGIDTDGTAAGDRLYSYGNSSLRGDADPLQPKYGTSLGDDARDGGWSHPLYTATPGIPGDSGSAFLSEDGQAVGTLSTLGLAPAPASNNIGDLAKELGFAQRHAGIAGLRMVRGTEDFEATPAPAG